MTIKIPHWTPRDQAQLETVKAAFERHGKDVDSIPPPRRPEMTVAEAHRRLWKRIQAKPKPKPSPQCYVCRRPTAIRREALRWRPVEFLVRLCRLHLETPGPRTSREILPYGRASSGALKRGNDATYLKRWGLIRSPERGVFELTRRGFDFVMGRIKVPRWVELYSARYRLGWSDERVSIRQVLGDHQGLLKKLYKLPKVRRIRKQIRADRKRRKLLRDKRRRKQS